MSSETAVHLKKIQVSEYVVRRALYWFSASAEWALSEDDNDWIVTFSSRDSKDQTPTLHRLVNDHLLREKIDQSTQGIRRSIIRKALADIERTS